CPKLRPMSLCPILTTQCPSPMSFKDIMLKNQSKTLSAFVFKGSKDKVKEHERSSVASHMALVLAAILDDRHSWMTAEGAEFSLKSTHGSSIVTNGDVDMSEDAEARGPLQREVRRNAETEEKVRVIENIISILNRELVNVNAELGARQEQSMAQVSVIKSLENKVAVLQHTLVMKDMEINQLDLRIQNLSQETYDGVFLWKIPNVALKLFLLVGHTVCLSLPVFYLAKYGYKACLRIYLNGDGAGRGTHISLFFTVMKGDYDALLAWPFKHKVTFTLLNQCNGDHLFDAFLPDITSPSFQQPVTDMNIASGCPLFCPLDKLQSPASPYIRDDTMFIRCAIDTSS
uniref:TNF receptor associated factor 1 n=1 Tax=Leptobrachium leishanense TaxID=445787 RepID=A0A8C5PD47_9ANUR